MKPLKQKLMLLGLAGATFLSGPASVYATPFDEKNEEVDEEKNTQDPFGEEEAEDKAEDKTEEKTNGEDPFGSEEKKDEKATVKKDTSFLRSSKGALVFIGGGVVLLVLLKVTDKNKHKE